MLVLKLSTINKKTQFKTISRTKTIVFYKMLTIYGRNMVHSK